MLNQKKNLLDDTEKYVIFLETFKFKHHRDNIYVRNTKSISYSIEHEGWYYIKTFDFKINQHSKTCYSTLDWLSKHFKDIFPKEYLAYKRKVKIEYLLQENSQDTEV
jgi:hypothetical protein